MALQAPAQLQARALQTVLPAAPRAATETAMSAAVCDVGKIHGALAGLFVCVRVCVRGVQVVRTPLFACNGFVTQQTSAGMLCNQFFVRLQVCTTMQELLTSALA